MIIGIGSDIVQHSMNTKFLEGKAGIHFANRVLSISEIDIYHQDHSGKFIAGRFAGKEAVLKCLGTGMQEGISLKDISILKLANGRPTIELSGSIKIIAKDLGIEKWHISISHSPTHSIAFVIAESN